MPTVVQSRTLARKVQGKYAPDELDSVIDSLVDDPHSGELFSGAGNLYRIAIPATASNGHDYDLVYIHHSSDMPTFLVNIFRRDEKALLDKTLACLVLEITTPAS